MNTYDRDLQRARRALDKQGYRLTKFKGRDEFHVQGTRGQPKDYFFKSLAEVQALVTEMNGE